MMNCRQKKYTWNVQQTKTKLKCVERSYYSIVTSDKHCLHYFHSLIACHEKNKLENGCKIRIECVWLKSDWFCFNFDKIKLKRRVPLKKEMYFSTVDQIGISFNEHIRFTKLIKMANTERNLFNLNHMKNLLIFFCVIKNVSRLNSSAYCSAYKVRSTCWIINQNVAIEFNSFIFPSTTSSSSVENVKLFHFRFYHGNVCDSFIGTYTWSKYLWWSGLLARKYVRKIFTFHETEETGLSRL